MYASLLGQREMDQQCRSARFVELARVDGRRLAFTKPSRRWGGHAADIVEGVGHHVWGAIYTVSRGDLDALDAREGVPDHYRRIQLSFAGGAACPPAWAYEAVTAMRRGEAAPSSAYLATILAGARERGVPEAYVAELERAVAMLPQVG